MRSIAAVFLGKTSGRVSRLLGRGGGTALPGLIASRIDPVLVHRLSSQIPCGNIIVTGTNGKTTTSRLVSSFLKHAGFSIIHNRTGSNLMRGLLTTLLDSSNSFGRLAIDDKTIGLFEVDEAVLPHAIKELKPKVIVFNNLFRDQLDRYGEVDAIAARWRQAVAGLPEETTIVLNTDDPLVAGLAAHTRAKVVFFGVNDDSCGHPALGHAADSKSCPECDADLDYRIVYFGHLGHYRCPGCGWERPTPDIAANRISLDGFAGTQVELSENDERHSVRMKLPGLYNVYNTLAAATATLALGILFEPIASGLESFTAAFGRIERVDIKGRIVYLALVKNPIGFNEVLRAVFADDQEKNLLFVLNDRIADGRDVSWIWDVEFEVYAGRTASVTTAGIRAEDMALRLKHAGFFGTQSRKGLNQNPEPITPSIEKNPRTALHSAVESLSPGGTLFVLPTYTAMIEIQDFLAKEGFIPPYWERE